MSKLDTYIMSNQPETCRRCGQRIADMMQLKTENGKPEKFKCTCYKCNYQYFLESEEEKELSFCCPECECTDLICTQSPVTSISDVIPRKYGIEYNWTETHAGNDTETEYQCKECDFTITDESGDPITDENELLEWLKVNQKSSSKPDIKELTVKTLPPSAGNMHRELINKIHGA